MTEPTPPPDTSSAADWLEFKRKQDLLRWQREQQQKQQSGQAPAAPVPGPEAPTPPVPTPQMPPTESVVPPPSVLRTQPPRSASEEWLDRWRANRQQAGVSPEPAPPPAPSKWNEPPRPDEIPDALKKQLPQVTSMAGYAMEGPEISSGPTPGVNKMLKPNWAARADAWLTRQAKGITSFITGEGRDPYAAASTDATRKTYEYLKANKLIDPKMNFETYARSQGITIDIPEIGTAGDTSNLFTSEKKDGKTQVAPFSTTGLRSLGVALTAQTPRIRAEAYRATLPGSRIVFGEGDPNKERPFIEWEGNYYQVNKPGLRESDLMKTAGDIIIAGILSRAGVKVGIPGMGAAPTSRLKNAAGQGGIGGATSIINDLAAWGLGSESASPINDPVGFAERAGLSGIFSGVLGSILGPRVKSAIKDRPEISSERGRSVLGLTPIEGKPSAVLDPTGALEAMPNADLIKKGRKMITDAGRDPDAFKPTQVVYIGNLSGREMTEPVNDVVNQILSRMSGVPIPLTKGQASLNKPAIGVEHALEKSTSQVKPGGASDVMTKMRDEQDARIRELTERMIVQPGRNEEALGRNVLAGVKEAEEAAHGKVKQAYSDILPSPEAQADMQAGRVSAGKEPLGPADLRGRSLLFKPHASAEVPTYLNDFLRANDVNLDEATSPVASQIMKDIGDRTQIKVAGSDKVMPKVFNVEDMEATRRMINEKAKAAANDTDFRAVMKIKEGYDKWVDDAIDRGLYMGDPEVVGKLKAARAMRTEYGKKFEPQQIDGTVGDVIQKMVYQDLNGKEVANFVLGAHGITGGRSTRQIVDRIAKIGGGENSPLMESVRDGVRRRILYGDNPEATNMAINPAQMAKRIRDAFKGDGDAVTQRLLPGEKQEWLALADRLMQVGKRERGSVPTVSSSESGLETVMGLSDNFLVRMLMATGKTVGGAAAQTPIVRELLEGGGHAIRKGRAERATNSGSTPLRKLIPGMEDGGYQPFGRAGEAGTRGAVPGLAGARMLEGQVPSLYDQMFGGQQ